MSAKLAITFIVILVILASIFASFETSVTSTNPLRFKARFGDKKKGIFKICQNYLDNIDDTITRTLIVINAIHAIYATIITLYVGKTFGKEYLGLSIIIATIVMFIFGEMLPKLLANILKEKFLVVSTFLSYLFLTLVRPFSFIFLKISTFLVKILSSGKKREDTFSEEDVQSIAKDAVTSGNITNDTETLIKQALAFDDKTVLNIMEPWNKVEKILSSTSPSVILKRLCEHEFTRLPVEDENGKVIGLYNIKKFLQQYARVGDDLDLKTAMFPPFYLKSNVRIIDALKTLSSNKVHMAFIQNESDVIIGIVTIEDILEELVGEIKDEEDI